MPLPYEIGAHGTEIEYWQAWFQRMYHAYAPTKDGVYGDGDVAAVNEMQRRLGLPQTGVFDDTTAQAAHYDPPPPNLLPIMFTVEGHLSNMFSGPVADTATALESEGICHHQPIGYDNGALPFDNDSGVNELARLVGTAQMDNGVPFPEGTPWSLGIYSQGAIVGSYFYFRYLQPGQPLAWRTPDLKGVLAYANPCRQTDSIASWAEPWVSATGTHGLDPNQRFGLPGFPAKPDNWVDVYRGGDIFAENGDDQASAVRAAVYEAVMNDWTSDPFSLAGQIAATFHAPFQEVLAVIEAIISGAVFLASNPNPHYAPFELTGGEDWMRGRLTTGAVPAPQFVPEVL
ncbi:peptidoglycan-binding domain-containing protein [Mycolicibacterium sp. CBMA 234]|uniref:peptidoglycan-binding domain-containing protein n=1 Tax=Mycolicibacterium sp. CBMA 234 TaxID=1918495 RepID=UPI0012DDE750|nr:peptidoglycan-binding domain-containing protein [Mycolicibacterium sp. CBMA 234]